MPLRRRQQVPCGQRVLAHLGVLLEQGLGLAAWLVLVVGVLLHVDRPEPLGLVDERSLLSVSQEFPLSSQPFADLRVVHFGILLGHLAPLAPGPDHERIHGPLDFIHGVASGWTHRLGARVRVPVAAHVPGHVAGDR